MPPTLQAVGASGHRSRRAADSDRVRRNQYCKKLACAPKTRTLSVRRRIGTGLMRWDSKSRTSRGARGPRCGRASPGGLPGGCACCSAGRSLACVSATSISRAPKRFEVSKVRSEESELVGARKHHPARASTLGAEAAAWAEHGNSETTSSNRISTTAASSEVGSSAATSAATPQQSPASKGSEGPDPAATIEAVGVGDISAGPDVSKSSPSISQTVYNAGARPRSLSR